MTILQFREKKRLGKKLSLVTCYDYTSAKIVDSSDVDAILVGDSLAMTMLGYKTTLPATVDIMSLYTSAVCRGATNKLIIGDMPFLSFRKDLTQNMDAVEKIMQAGAHAVKIEGIAGNEHLISHIVASGVPVMGHLGLTPQSVHQLGGYKVQGRESKAAELIIQGAKTLQDCGAFSIVLECVPSSIAAEITRQLEIPVIGIGAGPDTDGQILVFQDLLGLNTDFKAKFVRSYLNGHELFLSAFNAYTCDVQNGQFPAAKESFE